MAKGKINNLRAIDKWLKKQTSSLSKDELLIVSKKAALPLGLSFLIFFLFVSLVAPKDQFQQAKEALVNNQTSLEPHLVLTESFLKNNQIEAAEKELALAQEIDPENYRLQALWQKKQTTNPKDIERLVEVWKKILLQKPDYRDAHLQLVILYYKLGNVEKAQKHLEEAIIIDPNFEPARKLDEKLASTSGARGSR